MISGKPAVISPGSLLLPVLLGGNALGTDGSDVILEIFHKPTNQYKVLKITGLSMVLAYLSCKLTSMSSK